MSGEHLEKGLHFKRKKENHNNLKQFTIMLNI